MSRIAAVSWRRLVALCRKESYQIVRDPSSLLIAFVLPVILLTIFGYGVNLDATRIRIGILNEDSGADAALFVASLAASPYFEPHSSSSRAELTQWLTAGQVRGIVILQSDFGARLVRPGATAPVELITDGAEPNTANFVAAYVAGAWQSWARQRALNKGVPVAPPIDLIARYWFNPAALSRNFIVPGSIAIIMTIIGALLTSLVIAREWERGTMEALLSTPVTRLELLLSKILPYYVLGMLSMLICLGVGVWMFEVPFRGSLALLVLYASLFLGSALGLGLLLSTVLRNQFNAAQAALNAAFLPAMMLSGFLFEIPSMPVAIQAISYVVPARYLIPSLQSVFLVGDLWPMFARSIVILLAFGLGFFALAIVATRRRIA